ncbi:protein of unknown function DUF52 [Magnetococcus marinus MC-1]|uniref:MEMO1 family protein Mmc1_2152 n=1 Tax=Magnetococcus marinus (strain ATCC BAA-1437 / JCM 17883 / MC-1) TaxID=156889 RepID=A0L9L0_MAGMM|nr:AmmeMemoRadiSam system protein B [Magnetococcus marinus]ABK44653.1 protein of unknown function DUF52 [Magnetococcus marinus MC-1]
MASIKVTLSSAKPHSQVSPNPERLAARGYHRIRPAAVAGMFYPAQADALRQLVRSLLQQAPKRHDQGEPRAFVAPHAGYRYSGLTAAYAYNTLQAAPKERPRRVFLLGPSHRVALHGASLGNYDAFETPLGLVEVDLPLVERMAAQESDLVLDNAPHAQEHSLEVHLPFLQESLAHFRLVPMVFGRIEPSRVAEILAKYREADDLIVGSSDLSHFYDYDTAVGLDHTCNEAVLNMDLQAMAQCEACGNIAIRALMQTAQHQGWLPELADYRNSGDTAGDKKRVVGYASYLFMQPEQAKGSLAPLPPLVRRHLAQVLSGEAGLSAEQLVQTQPQLGQPGACFITLTKQGQLRGCIGSLQAHRSLAEDLLANGVAAALKDPRFPAVNREELDQLRVEVSLLTPAVKLEYRDSADLLEKLKPGVHGVILSMGTRRSTFLPQVWEQLPTPELFLNHLCKKAGLQGDCWQQGPEISVYTVEKVKEG